MPHPVFLRQSRGLIALMLLSLTQVALALTPVKSPNDHHAYRLITLDNGLEALLISNPASDKAAASMDVAVGSRNDPDDRQGLAHFLEHMLFLGTGKYPKAGEYQQFINEHGGSHNAMTTSEHTNYFFDISADFIAPALDRFSQQFIAPLFNADLVRREMNAVHSEYMVSRKEDSRRYFSAFAASLNPAHPLSRFAVGNLTTLADRPDDSVREDLLTFYQQHYSADRMKLVVYAPFPLDQLAQLVKAKFSAIPRLPQGLKQEQLQSAGKTTVSPEPTEPPLFAPGTLPALLQVESLKDIQQLRLTFPIPSQRQHYRVKADQYVANLLGHEGPGSLLQTLREAGWSDGLAAGIGVDTGVTATLDLDLTLTPAGLEHWQSILALTFAAIEQIRQSGIQQTYYAENAHLAELGFRFQEAEEPIRRVSELSMALQEIAAEDILQYPWMMGAYAPAAYRALLDRLTPDNVLVSLLSKTPLGKDAQKTQWYDTPFVLSSLHSPASAPAALVGQLALPAANPFIPEDLRLLPGKPMAHPIPLTQGKIDLWWAENAAFGTPKADVFISLRSPLANASAKESVLTQLLLDAVNESLNAFAYPAQLAGLDYTAYGHLRGITLRVSGYNDKLYRLLQSVLVGMAHPQLSAAQFARHRQRLLDELTNQRKQTPFRQAMGAVHEALITRIWSHEEKQAAAETVQFADLQAFAARFYAQLQVIMLANGNLTSAAALNLAQLTQAILLQTATLTPVARSQVRQLPANTPTLLPLAVDHPDTGFVAYFQGNSLSGNNDSDQERALFQLLSQLLSTPFYTSFRTQQQLGYVVFASSFELLEQPGLAFVVQSPVADAASLSAKLDVFLNVQKERLDQLSAEEFERQKQAVIAQLREPDKTLTAISQRYWQELDRPNTAFDSRERLIRAVQKLTLKAIRQGFEARILPRRHELRVVTGQAFEPGQTQAAMQQIRQLPRQ